MTVYYSLYGQLLSKRKLYNGFRKVWKATGVAGIDGQSLKQFAANLNEELECLVSELRAKQYPPQAVKRVEIPKPDGGARQLGIPAVRDRVVQQALTDILTPIFDPHFHPSSYGYRKGRSCHDAINKASLFIRTYGRRHVVDMDLSKCFDRLNHELIINAVSQRVKDGSVLHLIRQFLTSGVMVADQWEATEQGSPQGGVISPLLANIYLDAFDQAMKDRGHRIVRYADDILILCKSRQGAENALAQAKKILEVELKLEVNRDKTHIAHSDDGVKFLGVEIGSYYTRIQAKKVSSFKQKLKALTKRNRSQPLKAIIQQLNPLLRGFFNYFKIANGQRVFAQLAGWLRRRLRAIQLKLWKKPQRLHRRLRQLGYGGHFKAIRMKSWRNAASPLAHYAMPNKWFEELGLFSWESNGCVR